MRERGLKLIESGVDIIPAGRSREGAWIEMAVGTWAGIATTVAPARERGLKFCQC